MNEANSSQCDPSRAVDAATNLLLDQTLFTLDMELFDAFAKTFENPPMTGPKLHSLLKRVPIWEI